MKKLIAAIVCVIALSRPLTAQISSGLLLGVTECPDVSCTAGTTYWIVRSGSTVRIAAQGKGLLLPRNDGFWWVDFVSGVGRRDANMADAGEVCEVEQVSDLTTSTEATADEDYESIPAFIRATRAAPGGDVHVDSLYDGDLAVSWLGPDWISVAEETVDNAEHIWTTQWLVPFPSNAPVTEIQFASDSVQLSRAQRVCERELFGPPEEGETDPDAPPWHSMAFTVERMATRWALAVLPSDMRFRDDERGCPLPKTVAPSFFGHDTVRVSWAAIKNVLPGATTAFESPTGDLLLVRQDSTLFAFLPRNGVPGAIVARMSIAGRPVMTEWAVGTHARRWNAELSSLLAAGTPARQ